MGKRKRNQQSADELYEGYVNASVPDVMLTPSEAVKMNRDTPNNAFMQKVGDEFYYPEELMPAVSIAGITPSQERTARNIAEGNAAANELSEKQNYVGSKYVAPAFATAMAAPWLISAGAYAAANHALVGNTLMSGLRYLQPSTYLDPLIGGSAGAGIAAPSYYTMGARTLAGGLADALMDSYFATEGARNFGKTGSVPGEIMNALNFLPLVAPGANALSRGYNSLAGIRAAREANEAARAAASERGLVRAIHNASGSQVWIDPSTNKPFQYINGEFVPFNENSEWIPNSLRDEAIARLNEERAELPFYSPDDDLSMVTERQLQDMAADWRNDPSMARAATDELSRRGILSRAALERPRMAINSIQENPDVQALLNDLDLTETGRGLASPDLPPPPPEVNNVADTSRNVLEPSQSGLRVLGNVVTDEGGLLSRDVHSLSNDELNLVINSGHATEEHLIESGRRANRRINSWLDNTRIDETPSDELREIYSELENAQLNHGLSEGDEQYLNPEHYRRAIMRELLSRGEPVPAQTIRSATNAATSSVATSPQYGTLSSGRQIEPSMRIQDLSDEEFAELENLGGVPFNRRVGAMASRGDISADDRIALMRQYNYRRRTGRILDDDIEKAVSLGGAEGYRQLKSIASGASTTLDGLFEGRKIPDGVVKTVAEGRKEVLSGLDDRDLAAQLIRTIGDRAEVGIGTLDGDPYPTYMKKLRGDLHKAEIDALVSVLKKRFPNAGVDFSRMDTIDELAELQGFLRESGFVDWGTELPLDMKHMSYFSEGDPKLQQRAGVIGQDLTAKMPRKTAVTENNTSTQSELMKIWNAAKNYGTGPGETTIEYLKRPDGSYITTRRNHYGNYGFTLHDDGSVSFGVEKRFMHHNQDYDLSKNPFTREEVAQLRRIQTKGRVDTPEEQMLVDRFNDLMERADKAAMGEYDRAVEAYSRKSGIVGPKATKVSHDLFHTPFEYMGYNPDGSLSYHAFYESPYTVIYKHRLGGTLLRKYDGGGVVPVFSPLADFRSSRYKKNESAFQGFGGGRFGGAGYSSPFDVSLDPVVVSQYVRNTPITVERSFSDAYAAARKAGLPEFEFNGQTYNTDYDPNAKLGPRVVEQAPVLNMREVLDENKNPIRDSTRFEPWLGQIPGTHRRDYGGLVRRIRKAYGGDSEKILTMINKVREGLK